MTVALPEPLNAWLIKPYITAINFRRQVATHRCFRRSSLCIDHELGDIGEARSYRGVLRWLLKVVQL